MSGAHSNDNHNEVKVMNVDYKKYNKKQVEEFYRLLEGEDNER